MPKVAWGVGADEIEQAQSSFVPYSGPLVPKGVYTFTIKTAQFGRAQQSKNPMLKLLMILDGAASSTEEEDRNQYDGAPVWDNITAIENTAWKVKQFCEALGITPSDFANKTVMNDNDDITKIGRVKFDGTVKVRVLTTIEPDQKGEPRPRVAQYIPLDGEAVPAGDDEPDPDDEPMDDATEASDAAEEEASGVPTEEQLNKLDNDALKQYARDCGVELKGKNRTMVIQEIIAKFQPADEAADDAGEEDPF